MKTIQELKNELKEAKKKAFGNAKTASEVVEIWNQDKRTKIPKECKKLFCRDCRQNYYNGTGAKECWNLDNAKLKEKLIYPTLNSKNPDKIITLSCFVKEYPK